MSKEALRPEIWREPLHITQFWIKASPDEQVWTPLGVYKLLGEQLHASFSNERLQSKIFICSQCGSVWGRRIILVNHRHYPNVTHTFKAINRPCISHGGGWFIEENEIAEDLPHELVKYELLNLNLNIGIGA